MKLYVIPIGSGCNARCKYCITKFRKMRNSVLDLKRLNEVLATNEYDKIEITGGGEPSLHPQINEIVSMCSGKCPTNIYTNGSYKPCNNGVQVCLSRAHYNDADNEEIMGISYDLRKFVGLHNLKLSLMLHKGGISSLGELEKYLSWASNFARKVVVRQLFEYEDTNYQSYFAKEYVSSVAMAEKLGKKHPYKEIESNYFFDISGLEVEFEGRSCACEVSSPVLGADGVQRSGWGEL